MITDFYTKTFTVESPTSTKSSIGSWNPTWSSTGTGTFLGWMDYLGGQDQLQAAQMLDVATHVIGCSSTVSWVTNRMRIKDSDNNIYRVLHNDDPVFRSHHREIYLQFHKGDALTS